MSKTAIRTAIIGYGLAGRSYRGIVAAIADGAPLPVEPEEALTGLRIIESATC